MTLNSRAELQLLVHLRLQLVDCIEADDLLVVNRWVAVGVLLY